MDPNQQYSAAEVERMMKLQDVLLKAMAGKMHWWEAAEIIGVTTRTMRRWRERMAEHGYDGLTDRRGKGGSMEALENQRQVFHRSHSSLEISPTARDSHFPTAPTTASPPKSKKSKRGKRAA